MFFTQEDYRKIEKWLLANSRKDTEFAGASLPLKGNETVAFVQDGKNVNVLLKDLIEQIFLLGVSDFLNVTDKYGESRISLTQAIQLIPYKSRKIGQVITFLDEDGGWKLFQFQGERVNQWNNATLWVDLIKIIQGISIIDSEDITATVGNLNQTSLTFADKNYNTTDYSGLGRVYLRKNIQTVVNPNTNITYSTNFLTQAMLGEENTIYIIQYDYNLNGQTITIPSGCVLLFEGGSISNGIIIGNDTILWSPSIDSNLTDIQRQGTFRFCEKNDRFTQANAFYTNLLEDTFISSKWINNGSTISDNICNISNSSINRKFTLKANKNYVIACMVKVDNMTSTRPLAYCARNGIGMRIRDNVLPQYGEPIVNIDFCGIMHNTNDYIPVLKTIKVNSDLDVDITLGCIYTTIGVCTGSIIHAGIYDITNSFNSTPTYKELYNQYKEIVSLRIGYKSTNNSVIYPDSDARDSFISEMNERANYYQMHNSLFYNPSGNPPYRDPFNNTKSYRTIIPHTKRVVGKVLLSSPSGAGPTKVTPQNNTSFSYQEYYGLNSNNIYTISNIKNTAPNRLCYVLFYKDTTFLGQAFPYVVGAPLYKLDGSGSYSRYNRGLENENLLIVPPDCDNIVINSGAGDDDIPVLTCYSNTPMNGDSVELNSTTNVTEWRRLSNRSCVKDLCILYSVAATNKKLQELWNQPYRFINIRNGSNSTNLYISMPSTNFKLAGELHNDYFVIGGKGGSWDTQNIFTYGLVLRSRSTNKTYAISMNHTKAGRTENIYDICKKLLDRYIQSESDPADIYFDATSTEWENAAICEINQINPFEQVDFDANNTASNFYPINYSGKIIGKGTKIMFNPMSTTKIMTSIIALDYLALTDTIKIVSSDLVAGSGLEGLTDGDTISVRDAIIILLSTSDNSIATALSRIVGQRILTAKDY
jgi:hypothetical protein